PSPGAAMWTAGPAGTGAGPSTTAPISTTSTSWWTSPPASPKAGGGGIRPTPPTPCWEADKPADRSAGSQKLSVAGKDQQLRGKPSGFGKRPVASGNALPFRGWRFRGWSFREMSGRFGESPAAPPGLGPCHNGAHRQPQYV